MKVPPLTFRIDKGSPLSSTEHDENLKLIRDFCDGLARLFEIAFNPDGTLKNNTVPGASLQDRAVTQAKLDWLANFFTTASGVDNYSATISPNAGFGYGDGAATAFFCIVKFTNANTGAATLDVNTGGAKDIRKNGGSAPLIAGDIAAGSVHVLIYDGINFQMVSPISDPSLGHGQTIIGAGAGNFTVPVGVYVLEVECVGAGGGGGGTDPDCNGGGGGGYVYKRMAVTPGDIIAYSVGAAGTASTGGNAGDGGDTTFGTLTAGGGKGGDANKGAGGTAAGGDLNIPGENGAYGGGVLSETTKRTGGGSGRGMGYGGWINGATVTLPTGYGAGGHGDAEAAGGFASSAGTDGVIIIKW